MGAMASRLFAQPFGQEKIKENVKAPRHWPLRGGIHRWPVDSPHKGPVTRKMFPCDDVIIFWYILRLLFCIKSQWCREVYTGLASTMNCRRLQHLYTSIIWKNGCLNYRLSNFKGTLCDMTRRSFAVRGTSCYNIHGSGCKDYYQLSKGSHTRQAQLTSRISLFVWYRRNSCWIL